VPGPEMSTAGGHLAPEIRTARSHSLPALEPPAARELHLHFHGVDSADVAEILRRHERPE
jgi:hypothetical protein